MCSIIVRDVGWPKKKKKYGTLNARVRVNRWGYIKSLSIYIQRPYRGAHAFGCFYDDCFPFYLHKSRDEIFREHRAQCYLFLYSGGIGSVFCCSTCHGINPGHEREQIEVLIYYYYSHFYEIGRLGVGVAAVDIGQQPS